MMFLNFHFLVLSFFLTVSDYFVKFSLKSSSSLFKTWATEGSYTSSKRINCVFLLMPHVYPNDIENFIINIFGYCCRQLNFTVIFQISNKFCLTFTKWNSSLINKTVNSKTQSLRIESFFLLLIHNLDFQRWKAFFST